MQLKPSLRDKLSEMFGADLRSLAALRIGVALLILYDLAQRLRDLVAHYTDFGLLPRTALLEETKNRWITSFHLMSGTWEIQLILFFLAGLFALALLVGYRTRLVTLVSWIFLVSLHARNPFVNGGGDIMLRIFLFWCLFLPWGARYSVDSAWRGSAAVLRNRYLSIATIGFFMQFLFMYWFSVVHKTGPEWRTEGSAMYYALSLDYIVTSLGRILLEFPLLLKAMTFGVFWFEVVGPLLLISPFFTYQLRFAGIFGFWILHLGILFTLGLGTFPLMNILCMLLFIPTEFWDKLHATLEARKRAVPSIYYDADCRFCFRAAQLIRGIFGFPSAALVAAQSNPSAELDMRSSKSWIVEVQGTRYSGYKGFLAIADSSPFLAPLMPLLRLGVMQKIGDKAYSYVASHRKNECAIDPATNSGDDDLKLSAAANAFVGFMIVYVFLWNVAGVPGSGLTLSERVRSLGNLLRLNQKWAMFAPSPAKGDGWFVIPGRLQGGQIVNVIDGGKPVHWAKPALISATFKNDHWRKLMETMRKQKSLFPHYAAYLCRDWNRRRSGSEKLLEVEIMFLSERTQPDYAYSPIEKVSFLKHQCVREPTAPVQEQDT